ncbi:MAG: ribose-5-phosphate isomerase RpiA [bacterium]
MADVKSELKKKAAEKAVEQIKSGMVIGLGSGSTACFATLRIGELLKSGELKNVIGIPSSIQTENLARELGIPLATFKEYQKVDITIDGADEVDENLNLIKGGGGALLHEKILAQATKKEIIIVDESKVSKYLGTNWAVPIEVVPFALEVEKKYLESIGGKPVLRMKGEDSYITDEGNYLLDTNFGEIKNPAALSGQLNGRAGIAEHGLFIGLASEVIVAKDDGIIALKKVE